MSSHIQANVITEIKPESRGWIDKLLDSTWTGVILIAAACLLIGFMPYLISQKNLFGFSFLQTGPIGDTIGGITAPFVGILGAVLVYLTLRAQIQANDQIRKQIRAQEITADQQRNFSNLLEIYNHVKNDLDQITVTQTSGTSVNPQQIVVSRGPALKALWSRIARSYYNVPEQRREVPEGYRSFLGAMRILAGISSSLSTKSLSDVDREALISLISYLYESRIEPYYGLPDEFAAGKDRDPRLFFPNELCEVVDTIKTNIDNGQISSFAANVNRDAELNKKIVDEIQQASDDST